MKRQTHRHIMKTHRDTMPAQPHQTRPCSNTQTRHEPPNAPMLKHTDASWRHTWSDRHTDTSWRHTETRCPPNPTKRAHAQTHRHVMKTHMIRQTHRHIMKTQRHDARPTPPNAPMLKHIETSWRQTWPDTERQMRAQPSAARPPACPVSFLYHRTPTGKPVWGKTRFWIICPDWWYIFLKTCQQINVRKKFTVDFMPPRRGRILRSNVRILAFNLTLSSGGALSDINVAFTVEEVSAGALGWSWWRWN